MPERTPESTPAHVYLGLGGNIGDVRQSFGKALRSLKEAVAGELRCSRLYSSSPWGLKEQPSYLNMAVELPFESTPRDLLKLVQRIEFESGRIRAAEERWGPRPLDIDILLFRDMRLDGGLLSIPHPRLHERNFVLTPLLDLLPPETIIPGYNQSLGDLSVSCPDDGELHPLSDGPWDEWRARISPT